MNLPDKLPTIDPNVRGIFDRIVETAVLIRKVRKSDEFIHAERRREQAQTALRELREREVKEAEAERLHLERAAETRGMPRFIPLR